MVKSPEELRNNRGIGTGVVSAHDDAQRTFSGTVRPGARATTGKTTTRPLTKTTSPVAKKTSSTNTPDSDSGRSKRTTDKPNTASPKMDAKPTLKWELTEKQKDELLSANTQKYKTPVKFDTIYDNKKRPILFRTMIPMCLYVNKSKKISRVEFPTYDKSAGGAYCNWMAKMSNQFTDAERKEWKLYNYWVFNFMNLPPLPLNMFPFQIKNKADAPYNTIGLTITGLAGTPNATNLDTSYANDEGIFSFLDNDDPNMWRFVTYTYPVPNTTKLYIYDTGLAWNTTLASKDSTAPPLSGQPDGPGILNSKTAKNGIAGPVGTNYPAQLYITPEQNYDMSLNTSGVHYLWVCEQEYSRFDIVNGTLVPNPTLQHGFGYLTSLKKSAENLENWMKFNHGDNNQLRSQLLTLNYKKMINPPADTYIIILSILFIAFVLFASLYLFKNKLPLK